MINFSIIYGKISEYTQEKLSLGALFYGDNQISVHISGQKFQLLKRIIDSETCSFILDNLKSIERYYKRDKFKINLFTTNEIKESLNFAIPNTNNTLHFSDTFSINKSFTEENIHKIISLYVENSKSTHRVVSSLQFSENIRQFKKVTKDNLTFKYVVTKKLVPKLEIPFPVNFAGKNGKLYLGNFLSSNVEEDMIYHKLNSFISTSKKIQLAYPDSKIYLITNIFEDNRFISIKDNLIKSKDFQVIDNTERKLDELSNEIVTNNCKPINIALAS